MKRSHKPIMILVILLAGFVITEHVLAFPNGWRLPLYRSNGYSEGRAVISNGPGEWYHTGVDAEAVDYFYVGDAWGTNHYVRAAHSGTVRYAGELSCPGQVVGIEQSDGKASLYYHLSSYTVTVGQTVSRGQLIGYVGNSGSCSDGAHLHFTARQDVDWNNPIYTGTPIVVSNLRGTGWYPWSPNPSYNSGFVVQTTSHPVGGACSTSKTIYVRWPPTTWIVGGGSIDGYSWTWSASSTTIPDDVKDGEETRYSASKTVSTDSTNWYFHLKVLDIWGNWSSSSEVVHLGPIWIATVCPTIAEP